MRSATEGRSSSDRSEFTRRKSAACRCGPPVDRHDLWSGVLFRRCLIFLGAIVNALVAALLDVHRDEFETGGGKIGHEWQ